MVRIMQKKSLMPATLKIYKFLLLKLTSACLFTQDMLRSNRKRAVLVTSLAFLLAVAFIGLIAEVIISILSG